MSEKKKSSVGLSKELTLKGALLELFALSADNTEVYSISVPAVGQCYE